MVLPTYLTSRVVTIGVLIQGCKAVKPSGLPVCDQVLGRLSSFTMPAQTAVSQQPKKAVLLKQLLHHLGFLVEIK